MMNCEVWEGGAMCGNFADLQDTKPEPFDYERTAKWVQPYDMEWREVLGNAVCNCTTVEVSYAPYYGHDYYHRPTCNLMRKLRAEPQIYNLREVYLPAMNQYNDSVENTKSRSIWVEYHGRPCKVNIRRSIIKDTRQVVLL